MSSLNPVLAVQAEQSEALGVEYHFSGTRLEWIGREFTLSWAGERNTLPAGSCPLMVLGGEPICGQGWTKEQVRDFYEITGGAVIYERR